MNDYLEADVLIIGCGIAGGTAALQLAEAGVPVTVVTRARAPEESNTYYAQGGIIYTSSTDTPQRLVEDVLHAGAGHSYEKAAHIMAREGPPLVQNILIEKLGIPFDRTVAGDLQVIKEAAHSNERIIHAADSTGKAIEIGLLNALKVHPNVNLLTGKTAVDLLTPSHHSRNRLTIYEPRQCIGAYVLDQDSDQVMRIITKKTVHAKI